MKSGCSRVVFDFGNANVDFANYVSKNFFSIFTDYKFPILEWAYCWLRRVVIVEKEDG